MGSKNTEELNRLNRARQEISEKENHISHLEAVIEEANAQMLRFLNEKAELTARQQRYEAMSEQVNLRRSEFPRSFSGLKVTNLFRRRGSQRKRSILHRYRRSWWKSRLQPRKPRMVWSRQTARSAG